MSFLPVPADEHSIDDASDIIGRLLGFFPLGTCESLPSDAEHISAMESFVDSLFVEASSLREPCTASTLVSSCLASQSPEPGSAGVANTFPPQSTADTREVLLFLLQHPPDWGVVNHSPRRLVCYARILAKVYRQLVVDTVHRRCRAAATVDGGDDAPSLSADQTQTMGSSVEVGMNSWGRDVLGLVMKVLLPALVPCDGEPQQVAQTVSIEAGKACASGVRPSGAPPERSVEETAAGGGVSQALVVLSALCLEIRSTTTSLVTTCQMCALALYAGLFAHQGFAMQSLLPFPFLSRGGGRATFVTVESYTMHLGLAATSVAVAVGEEEQEGGSATFCAVPTTEESALSLLRTVQDILSEGRSTAAAGGRGPASPAAAPDAWTRRELRRILSLTQSALSEVVALSSEGEGDHTAPDNLDYLLTDWEQGLARDQAKDITLRQEREAVRQSLTAWTVLPADSHASRKMAASPFSIDANASEHTLRLSLGGALFLLAAEWLDCRDNSACLSRSPTTVFADLLEPLSSSLASGHTVCSFSALLTLWLLADATEAESLSFPGEDNVLRELCSTTTDVNTSPAVGRAEAAVSAVPFQTDAPHTQQYAAFFELEKQLITLSVTCPVEAHRSLARQLVLRLLGLLDESSRVRMQCSLVFFAPFASVARSLFSHLMEQWNAFRRTEAERQEGATRRGHSGCVTVFDREMPLQLVDLAGGFLEKMKKGDQEFLDPLVVALNAFRLLIVTDRQYPRRRVFLDEHGRVERSWPSPSSSSSLVESAWPRALLSLRGAVLNECQRILSLCGDQDVAKVDDRVSLTTAPSLSPLDEFSLSTAVEALSALLPE